MKQESQGKDDSSSTVKFNVGGKLYEVAKSLLEGFPDTILAEKASSSSSSPVFIDRDPDRFAYCLDFMRDDGNVYLPETLSKLAFLKELEFFGFDDIDETKISDEKSQQNAISRFHQIRETHKGRIVHLEREVESLERDLERRKEEIKIEKVALKCFVASASVDNIEDQFDVDYSDVKGLRNVEAKQHFIECCDKLGLRVGGSWGSSAVCMSLKTDRAQGREG